MSELPMISPADSDAETAERGVLPVEVLGELRELTVELQASRVRIVEAADEARRRIERDLHDGAQQRLVTAAMELGLAMQAARRGELEGIAEQLGRVRAELDGGLAELRDLARGIHPAILSDRGLRAAVDALVAHSSVPVSVHGDVDRRLPASVEAALYFTVAEALTNVAKYAGAAEAVVTISNTSTQAEVEIRDDGRGGANPQAGSGLRGLVDRLSALGGHLHVNSDPGTGTTVYAVVPLEGHLHAGNVCCGCCDVGQCRCAP